MARNKSIRSRVEAYAKSTYRIESEQLPFNREDYAVEKAMREWQDSLYTLNDRKETSK